MINEVVCRGVWGIRFIGSSLLFRKSSFWIKFDLLLGVGILSNFVMKVVILSMKKF